VWSWSLRAGKGWQMPCRAVIRGAMRTVARLALPVAGAAADWLVCFAGSCCSSASGSSSNCRFFLRSLLKVYLPTPGNEKVCLSNLHLKLSCFLIKSVRPLLGCLTCSPSTVLTSFKQLPFRPGRARDAATWWTVVIEQRALTRCRWQCRCAVELGSSLCLVCTAHHLLLSSILSRSLPLYHWPV
jgi:hypothetical protein